MVLRHALDITELSVTVPEVGGALLAVKKVVRFMKQSGLASQLSKTVLQMGETRFSTVYLTLKSITDVYTELRKMLESRGEAQRMADVSPDVLDFLVSFLHPFYEAQWKLEGDQYPTLNLVVLWHERLKRHCQPVKTDMPYQATICQHHLKWIGKKVQIQQLHKLAIYLWPKFNLLRMFCETERDAILQDAKSWIASYRATGGNVTEEPAREVTSDTLPPAGKKRTLSDFELEWENVAHFDDDTAVDEVQIYLNLTPSSKEYDDRDLLGWWSQHEKAIPLLSRLARHVLSIPASSSSSERVFSTAGMTLEERRTSLKPSTVDAIIFLHNA